MHRISNYISQLLDYLFPANLESSGYIILSVIAGISIIFLIVEIAMFNHILNTLSNDNVTMRAVNTSLYIHQRLTDYKFFLYDINHAVDPVDKANARTQLYNFLNNVSMEIITVKDKQFAIQLAGAFASKIRSRYLKLASMPEGLTYFKYLGGILIHNPTEDIESLVKRVQKNGKKDIAAQKDMQRDTPVENAPKQGIIGRVKGRFQGSKS